MQIQAFFFFFFYVAVTSQLRTFLHVFKVLSFSFSETEVKHQVVHLYLEKEVIATVASKIP